MYDIKEPVSECVSVLGSEKRMGVTDWHLTESPLYEEWRGRKKRGGQRRERRKRAGKEGERGRGEGMGEEGKGKELEVTFQLSQSGSFRLGRW